MKLLELFENIIKWIHARLSKRQFLIFSSMLVGITTGLAAIVLKLLVHFIYINITSNYFVKYTNYAYVIAPLIGILLTVFIVQYFFKGKLGRGLANILKSIIKKSGFLPKDQMYSHIVTSALTVGFGGSAGLESPIVSTGSAIGSNYGRTYHIGYKDRVLLLACGAASGIAAMFNAPIAGVLFALEVLLVDISISAFIPIMIAAVAGGLCSKIILNENILLSFHLKEVFNYQNVPFYIMLGLLAGFTSVYYARVYTRIEEIFKKRKQKIFENAIIGGSVLAILLLLFPSLFGEGYSGIKLLSEAKPEGLLENSLLSPFINSEWLILAFVGIIMLVKVIATSITINSGGNGGNFAPSLFVGAYLGYFFARCINLLGIAKIPENNFSIVAMSGILTGVFYAPLTGIFLIAEITGGYDLMIPLMIVSAISFTIVKYFEPLSMEAKKLAKSGHIFTQNKDRTILSTLEVSKILETDFQKIKPSYTLGELVNVIAHSHRNIFPVINEKEELVGIITLDNIREIMFKSEVYTTVIVQELMTKPPAIIHPEEDMHSVMKKFDETAAWNLPVVEKNIYKGFISKSSLLTKYRKSLIRTQV